MRVGVEESQPGDKIVYLFDSSGRDCDKNIANKYLKLMEVYTISDIDVGNWHTDVWLEEVPGVAFNSVHFGTSKENT